MSRPRVLDVKAHIAVEHYLPFGTDCLPALANELKVTREPVLAVRWPYGNANLMPKPSGSAHPHDRWLSGRWANPARQAPPSRR